VSPSAVKSQPTAWNSISPEGLHSVLAVYPNRKFASPKVRILFEALAHPFGDDPSADPW